MPLITDGDITEGFIRKRVILRKLYEQTVMSRSHLFREYVKGMTKTTGIPEEKVIKSEPVRKFLRRLAGV